MLIWGPRFNLNKEWSTTKKFPNYKI
jgi:hypothetical protein